VEEISEPVWDQVAEGQPVLLVRDGIPAAVVVDVESWQEAVQLAELAIRPA
jgi:prevent-host-death family protein